MRCATTSGRWRRAAAQACRSAPPLSWVERLPLVTASSGLSGVAAGRAVMRPKATSSSSAAIWLSVGQDALAELHLARRDRDASVGVEGSAIATSGGWRAGCRAAAACRRPRAARRQIHSWLGHPIHVSGARLRLRPPTIGRRPPLLRRAPHRADDSVVAAAAAEMRLERRADRAVIRIGVARQQRRGGDQDAGRGSRRIARPAPPGRPIAAGAAHRACRAPPPSSHAAGAAEAARVQA